MQEKKLTTQHNINPSGNNARDHIPKATVQLRHLTATSTSRDILFTAEETRGLGMIQTHRNWNLTSIPGTSKKSYIYAPDWHLSHLKEDKKNNP